MVDWNRSVFAGSVGFLLGGWPILGRRWAATSGSIGGMWSRPSLSIPSQSREEAPWIGALLLKGRSLHETDTSSNISGKTGRSCLFALVVWEKSFPS
ncbi:hypothetical protein KUCAC02_009770 [Chaenocephalus aceratus]|uniref:Uncharacterized protein n=1 Tax=Chaenocephalus aceratus TaxID=36190 RepID=A0ACB9VYM8_CHAAC|nr:hypothetical protein KUCAC02_009770 [Chaenocephalus aceratus]